MNKTACYNENGVKIHNGVQEHIVDKYFLDDVVG
jgi:hypothetical protein